MVSPTCGLDTGGLERGRGERRTGTAPLLCQVLGVRCPPAPRSHSAAFSEAPVNDLATRVLPCPVDKLRLALTEAQAGHCGAMES